MVIVVPSLTHKQLPYSWGTYSPTPTELFIMAATFAAMVLLYTLFAKFVPIISIWELKAGETEKAHVVAQFAGPSTQHQHAPHVDVSLRAGH